MKRVPEGNRNGLFYFCRNDLPVIGRSEGHTWRAGQVLEKTILSEKIRPPVPGPACSSFLLRCQQLLHGDLHSARSQKADLLSEFLISPFFFFFAPGTTAVSVLVLKGFAYSRTESARIMRLPLRPRQGVPSRRSPDTAVPGVHRGGNSRSDSGTETPRGHCAVNRHL